MPRLPEPHRAGVPRPADDLMPSRQTDYRGWYSSPTWRRLRQSILVRDAWICAACGTPAGQSANVDHITPHAGNWDLFTEPTNLQTLCHGCHSRKTLKEQK